MRIHNKLHIVFIILFYIFLLFITKKDLFYFKFDTKLIDRYFLSQDIPYEVKGKRLFLSDADIYSATGYLYAHGEDPSKFNFEHPPLIKYIFGFSTRIFGNPYISQFLLGAFFLFFYYIFCFKITNNSIIAFFSTFLLSFDPLFLNLSSQLLLDIGQALFLLLYFISFFYYKKNYIFQGIVLGLFAGTKFWVTPLFFIALFTLYKIFKKELNLKIYIYHLIVASITYSALYINSFIAQNGNFNIIWHILKTFKYRLVHNTSTFFGASIILFLTGFIKAWWGNKNWIWALPWSPLWGISLLSSFYNSYFLISKNKINTKLLINLIPLSYLIFLGVQAPFPRYFFIILPFIYLLLTQSIYNFVSSKKLKYAQQY